VPFEKVEQHLVVAAGGLEPEGADDRAGARRLAVHGHGPRDERGLDVGVERRRAGQRHAAADHPSRVAGAEPPGGEGRRRVAIDHVVRLREHGRRVARRVRVAEQRLVSGRGVDEPEVATPIEVRGGAVDGEVARQVDRRDVPVEDAAGRDHARSRVGRRRVRHRRVGRAVGRGAAVRAAGIARVPRVVRAGVGGRDLRGGVARRVRAGRIARPHVRRARVLAAVGVRARHPPVGRHARVAVAHAGVRPSAAGDKNQRRRRPGAAARANRLAHYGVHCRRR
jgi:hypothetical protein